MFLDESELRSFCALNVNNPGLCLPTGSPRGAIIRARGATRAHCELGHLHFLEGEKLCESHEYVWFESHGFMDKDRERNTEIKVDKSRI